MSQSLKYLLDTNILSDLIRNPQGVIAEKISKVGEDVICTDIIVAAELRYGATKLGSVKLTERINLILSALEILPLETPIDYEYATLRHQLTSAGELIGSNDLLIAAHALAHQLTVVTANVKEFSRVPNLKLENWLQK